MPGGKCIRKNLAVMVILFIILPEFILINPTLDSTTSIDTQIFEMPNKRPLSEDANELLANAPSVFTENRGQLENDEVRFYTQDGSVWFTDEGVWFELQEEIEIISRESRVKRSPTHPHD